MQLYFCLLATQQHPRTIINPRGACAAWVIGERAGARANLVVRSSGFLFIARRVSAHARLRYALLFYPKIISKFLHIFTSSQRELPWPRGTSTFFSSSRFALRSSHSALLGCTSAFSSKYVPRTSYFAVPRQTFFVIRTSHFAVRSSPSDFFSLCTSRFALRGSVLRSSHLPVCCSSHGAGEGGEHGHHICACAVKNRVVCFAAVVVCGLFGAR